MKFIAKYATNYNLNKRCFYAIIVIRVFILLAWDWKESRKEIGTVIHVKVLLFHNYWKG